MVSEGGNAMTHIYIKVILSGFKSVSKSFKGTIDWFLGRTAPYVKGLLRILLITAIVDAITYIFSWITVPFIMLLESMLGFYMSFRAANVAELLYLDINENLIDTAFETVLGEVQKAIAESELAAHPLEDL